MKIVIPSREIQEAGFKSLSLSLRPKGPALQAIGIGQSLISKSTTSESEDLVVETPLLQSIPNSRGEIVSFDPMASPQATCQQKHRTTQQEKGAYNLGFAILRLITMEQESILIKGSGKERRISAQRTRCDLRIAQWLWSRGFSWQSFGVYGSWQHSFRTFRYIPANALIVEFCCEGDLANVQRMFDKGLASPFDRVAFRDEDWSLLHVSRTTMPMF